MERILETERLTLRKMGEGDLDALRIILQDPDVMYAYEGPFDEAGVREWLDRQTARYRTDGFGLWAVVLKETDRMIGQCGVTLQEYRDAQVMEVGYLFMKAFWHRGVRDRGSHRLSRLRLRRLGCSRGVFFDSRHE
ncbi:GNAT family N-acetyltransferase [Paraeggerthella sp.]|uniref:GNAT family N-acetyltransferase n=1 Tax=Paraeggerthella sp. TaxID=2897350 RepID=UPI003527AF19